jgi:hypothetical protein
MSTPVVSDDRTFAAVDRLMRQRPLSHTDASIERAAIEAQNRAVRDRLRARRGPVVFSTLD